MKFTRTMTSLLLCLSCGVAALGFSGQFAGVPHDAIQAQNNLQSSVLNGLNYQSRIDIKLLLLSDGLLQPRHVPVFQPYTFVVDRLDDGEYELYIHSYDFSLQNEKYHVTVLNDTISVYEQTLISSYNQSLVQTVTLDHPLVVQVTGYKEYYESPQGKLTDMVMSSPFGFVFRSKLYTALFVMSITIMAFPYVLPLISPELAQEYKSMQAGSGPGPSEGRAALGEIPIVLPAAEKPAVASGVGKSATSAKGRNLKAGRLRK